MRRSKRHHYRPKVQVDKSLQFLNLVDDLYMMDKDAFEASIITMMKNPIKSLEFKPKEIEFRKNLHKHKYIVSSKNIEQIIFLLLQIIKSSKKRITRYLQCKEEVELNILNGNYDSALSKIELHKNEFGFSYWYLEVLFGIYANTDEKSKSYKLYKELSNSLSDIEKRDLSLLLERSSNSVSSERFDFVINSLVDSIEKKSKDRDLVKFIFSFNANDNYDVKSILEFSLKLNLPDIYNILSRSISYLLIDNHSYADTFNQILRVSTSGSSNKYDEVDFFKQEYVEKEYILSLESYFSGDNINTRNRSLERINIKPNNYMYYDLLVKSSVLSKLEFNYSGIIGKYLSSCIDFLNDYNLDSLEGAIRLNQQFNSINALQFVNIIRTKELNSFIDGSCDKVKRFTYLSSCLDSNVIHAVNLSEHIRKIKNNKLFHTPDYRKLKWKADDFFEQSDFENYIKTINLIKEHPRHMINEIIERTIYSKYRLSKFDDIIDRFISLLIHDKFGLTVEFVKAIYNDSDYNIDKGSVDSILFNYVLFKLGIINLQRLSLICDAYLKSNNLISFEDNIPTCDKDYFLLSRVITVELIKKQRKKPNNDPLISRANIIRNLKKHGFTSNDMSRELDNLVRDYARKIYLKKVGKGKLYLNIDGLLGEMYDELHNEYEIISESVKELSEQINSLSVDDRETYAHELASDFLLKSRDIYAINEKFGLENSLNTHFRHNNIVPELRAPFVSSQLACTFSSKVYSDNVFVHDNFKLSLLSSAYEEFQEKTRDLSKDIDNSLNYLKETYLHVYLNDLQDSARLFKYEISKEDVFNFISMINAGSTYEDMLIWIVSLLNKKTNVNLQRGKDFITGELCSTLMEYLSKYRSIAESFVDNEHRFFKLIEECESEIYATCKDVSEWFSFIEHYSDDFDISVPILEAKDFVQRTNVQSELDMELNIDKNVTLSGTYLVSILHIFIILIQNAVKSTNNKTKVIIDINNTTELVKVKVSNEYDHTDYDKLKEIANNISQSKYLKGAKQDTGSGLYKVFKLMKIDMGNVTGLTLSIDQNQKKLEVSWSMTSGLKEQL
ncbi:TPA: hypothetical protein ACN33Q_000715 [Vibrio parahaemolyticus]|nr:hypothetical protein [Vibrio parahaemolyticus]